MEGITATNPKVVDFYHKNPQLNFDTMSLIMVDILENLSTNLNETIASSIQGKIISSLEELNKELTFNKHELYTKMLDLKREYLEDLKLVISNNSLSNAEKINTILEKNNDSILTKTNLLLNDIVPKNQEKYVSQIDASMKTLCQNFSLETYKLMENVNNVNMKDDKTIQEFIGNLDAQFTTMIGSIQQPIVSFIQSSEERTQSNLQQIREKMSEQQMAYQSLTGEFQTFFNKYKYNSSEKGSMSEKQLYILLQEIFPHDEILDCHQLTATCDYKVNRLNALYPTILFENKDYERNVNTEEVNKFQRDLALQKQHGIFISQNSSITYKKNYQIDIVNGIIHVYISKVGYDLDKIKIAVDIVDCLSQSLQVLDKQMNVTAENAYSISKEELEDLLMLYNDFTKQKNNIINQFKTSFKQVLDGLEELNINKVKTLLCKNNIMGSGEDDLTCKFCNLFNGRNKSSLAAHMRSCRLNPDVGNKQHVLVEPLEIQTNKLVVSSVSVEKGKKQKNNK